jgi:hypothetical protein
LIDVVLWSGIADWKMYLLILLNPIAVIFTAAPLAEQVM